MECLNPSDPHHVEARRTAEKLKALHIVAPWPTMYETLRTRFVRNPVCLTQFERFLKRPNIEFFDDTPHRQAAYDEALECSLRRQRPLSMTDCLIRLLLDDVNIRIPYLATLNHADFVDVCRKRGVEII